MEGTIMKKFIILSAMLVFAGCALKGHQDQPSSSGAVNDSAGLDTSDNDEVKTPGEEIVTDKAEKKAPPPASKAASSASLNDVQGQTDEQIYNSATQVLAQSPNDFKALNALAMYHYKQGHLELARFLLNKALAANANAAGVYTNLGLVQLAQDERRDAIKSFRKALSLKSDDAVAAANLGAIYLQEKDYGKALPALETACSKDPKDSGVWNNYAVALMANQKFDQAEGIFKKLLKDNSPSKEVLFNYATLLIDDMSKFQDGLDVLNRLKFVGEPGDKQNRIIALENKAKAGLK